MQLIVIWNLRVREALDNAKINWLQILKRGISGVHWLTLHLQILPYHCKYSSTPSNKEKKRKTT
eukprot:scaffold171446_cov18-Tisochrysis_lutea.AAC.1